MSYNLTGAAYGGNVSLSKAGLAAGTTTTYTTANALTYANKGVLLSFAAKTNAATPTIDALTNKAFVPLSANQAAVIGFFVDAAGNINAAQGPVISNLDLVGGLAAAQFPQGPDTLTPFGYLLAQAGPTLVGTWTFGTNNLSGVTGMTYTFRDIMDYPAQPITG